MLHIWGSKDIGIDLGTATVLVYRRGMGIVLNEPSVIAVDTMNHEVLAVGEEAYKMVGRTPGHIVAIRPLQDGVISDYEHTRIMLMEFLDKAIGGVKLLKPRVIVCVPGGVTPVEKKAVMEASQDAGAGSTYIIEEPIAAAVGAGLEIEKPEGNMVVDIGGGTSDIAVISLGGSVVSYSIKVAGDEFDEAIIRYMRRKHNLLIGERTAEDMKIHIGSLYPRETEIIMNITGRNLISGLPITVEVSSEDMLEALEEPAQAIVDAVRHVLEKTPPELAADLTINGIVMTGGGSLIYGFDKLLEYHTKIPVRVADDAISCVALGTSKMLENLDKYIELSVFDFQKIQTYSIS